MFARPSGRRLRAAQDHGLEFRRPAALGFAQRSGKHFHDGIRQRQIVIRPEPLQILHRHIVADEENRAVADDFARRRDLDDVAEREIQFRVGVRDFLPARAESHGFGLLAQIRVLPAGHFVNVNFRRARRRRVVERAIPGAHRLPIIGAGIERLEIESGVALGVLERGDDGIQVGLAGRAAHRSDRGVGGVHAGFRRFQDRSGIHAAGVMRVKMNRAAPTSSRRAENSRSAAYGLHNPPMSLMHRMCAPIFSSSFARRT